MADDLTTSVFQESEPAVESCVGKNFLTVETQLPENEQIRPFVLASWADMSPREEMLASIPDHVRPLCWGGRTWRAIPPLGEQGILFLGNAAPREPELSEGPKQTALKAPGGWNLIFSSTIGYKTQPSFLRHLDEYIIHLDNHS